MDNNDFGASNTKWQQNEMQSRQDAASAGINFKHGSNGHAHLPLRNSTQLYPMPSAWNSSIRMRSNNNLISSPETIHSSTKQTSSDCEVVAVSNSAPPIPMPGCFRPGSISDTNAPSAHSPRNPHFASLIHTQNVLCRQLEQLTDHNIHLATRNSELRTELEQSKEENVQMVGIRQIQAQQACKQAAEYEALLIKYEKSIESIREMKNVKSSYDKKKNGDDEADLKVTILQKDNCNLRRRIIELQEINNRLNKKVKDLSSIIDGAGNLLHRQDLRKNEGDFEASSNSTGRKVTTDVSYKSPILKRGSVQNFNTEKSLPTNITNRQVTNEIALPSFVAQRTDEIVNLTKNSRKVTNDFICNKNNVKNNETYREIGITRPNSTHDYHTRMDKTLSVSAEQSRYLNVASAFNSASKVSRNMNLSYGDLRDEDEELTSDDDDVCNKKTKKKKKKSNENLIKMQPSSENDQKIHLASAEGCGKHQNPRVHLNKSGANDHLTSITNLLFAAKSNHKNEIDDSVRLKAKLKSPKFSPTLPNNATPPKRKRGRPKRDKSEGWPKRPLSAYNLFFREQRIKILDSLAPEEKYDKDADEKDDEGGEDDNDKRKRGRPVGSGRKRRRAAPHGIITFENLGKKISQDWREAPASMKESYRLEAAANLKKYQEELEIFLKNKEKKEAEANQRSLEIFLRDKVNNDAELRN